MIDKNTREENLSKDANTEKWIAAYTKPRHEKVAYDQLINKGFSAYLPLLRQKRKWSDRKKWVEIPLFKSYIFVKIQLKNSLFVLQTNGINNVVKLGEEITVIRDEEILAIRQMIEGGYEPEGIDYFVEGDHVVIIEGPLKGTKGVVIQIKGKDQFVLKIDAIQHAVSCQIDRKLLKPLKVKNVNTIL
jgi:transcription antitermination factor NusG